jgi:small-conductance mechanosensitive channel/CRP-like cAMP-binding protein
MRALLEILSNVEVASALGRGFLGVVGTMMALTLVLRRVHAVARMRLRVATLFQFAGVAGILLSATLLSAGVDSSSFLFGILRDSSDVLLSVSIVTILGVILFDFVLEPLRMRPPPILTDLILAAGYVAAMILVLGHLGRDLSSVLTTSAIATAAIGFSLQDTLKSVMGGMSMQMDHSMRAGDWIRVDTLEGRVTEIRWRQTSIVTRDGDTVVIPNSLMAATHVTILGKHGREPRQTRRWIHFEIDHGVPTGDVIEAVCAALRESPVSGMSTHPEPDCVLLDLRSAWQTFALRYWLDDLADDFGTDSDVRTRIIAALQRIGVGFSFPTQSLLLHPKDESHLERSQVQEHRTKIDALSRVPVFAPLTSEEREGLAKKLVYTPFSAGETITRQGASADWLYMIVRGTAAVRVTSEAGGPERRVALLGPGDFFGEMALLTGAPRSATVVGLSEVVTYKLDKDSFLETIQARPSMAEEISRLLAQRRVELDAIREDLNEEAKRQRLTTAQTDLLSRIREFFRLY